MATRLASSIFLFMALLLFGGSRVLAKGLLDLVIPRFEVHEATLERAIRELHQWGVPICFERGPVNEPTTFSLSLRDVSVRDVLNALISADKRYIWEVHRSMTLPSPTLEIINVLPANGKGDPENLMNVRVDSLELKDINPAQAIERIYQLVPELKKAYWRRVPPGGVLSEIRPLTPPENEFSISLRLHGVSVRDVLNEITLRSGGVCWLYEYSVSPRRHTWQVFH
ncbi:hypothetical protein D6833_13810 [Candidatus Parcubacteria bacterium]|nr:MAG: hypothetical protein D6833_13810 [Candidatus Parcubacteria bacterium]